MKINITKKIVPIVLLSTLVVYGNSKIGKIRTSYNNDVRVENRVELDEDFMLNTSINSVNTVVSSNNIVSPNNIVDTNNVISTNTLVEEKQVETPSIDYFDKLTIETKKVVETDTTVNLRKEPNTTSDKLTVLAPNTTLDLVYEENEEWYKVKYNDDFGYVSSDYSKVVEQVNIKDPIQKIVYFPKNTNLYSDATNTDISCEINALEASPVYLENEESYLISLDNKIGYVKKTDAVELKDTFVIVDISDQTAALYENNELIVKTNVVTGHPNTPTTKGLHSVWNISSDRYLKGADYKVYVDVMMAFHNGEGLHDAEYHTHYNSNGEKTFSHGWRDSSSFGKDLYKTKGSHGCVNMPHDAAMTMYNTIELGDKVLVKE